MLGHRALVRYLNPNGTNGVDNTFISRLTNGKVPSGKPRMPAETDPRYIIVAQFVEEHGVAKRAFFLSQVELERKSRRQRTCQTISDEPHTQAGIIVVLSQYSKMVLPIGEAKFSITFKAGEAYIEYVADGKLVRYQITVDKAFIDIR